MVTRRLTPAECAFAWSGGILGAGSLLLFGFFLWSGALGVVELRMAQTSTLVWDAGLCLLFFLQHSGMVRRSFRAWLGAFVPAHCQGVVYTIASAVPLLLLVVLWQTSTRNLYILEGPAAWLVRAVLLSALVGVVWGIRSLEEFDAFGTETFVAHIRGRQYPPARLVIRGPYRWVRHPFYWFGIVAVWASPVMSLDRLVLASLFTAWIVFGAAMEERDLLAAFGEDYRRYQAAVPMFLPRPPKRGIARSSSAGGAR